MSTKDNLKPLIKECITEVVNSMSTKGRGKNIMETYYGILSNSNYPIPLNETSVDRILNKHGNEGMAIISANRSDEDARTNKLMTKQLISDIKKSGFSYIPVYGGYHGTDDVVDSYEPSFVVTCFDREGNKDDLDRLFDFAIQMCGKYNQDSVLFKAPNGTPNYYNRNGEKTNTSSTNKVIKNDPTQEFFTSVIKTQNLDKEHPERSKRFTYDIRFDENSQNESRNYCVFMNPKPTTLNERIRRRKSGEIIL